MLARSDVECLSRELAMTHVCSRAHGRRLNICLLHLLPPKRGVIVRATLSFCHNPPVDTLALDTSAEEEQPVVRALVVWQSMDVCFYIFFNSLLLCQSWSNKRQSRHSHVSQLSACTTHMKCDKLPAQTEHWGLIVKPQQLSVCRCASGKPCAHRRLYVRHVTHRGSYFLRHVT